MKNNHSKFISFFILVVILITSKPLSSQVLETEDFETGTFPPQGWSILNGNFVNGAVPQNGVNSCRNSQLIALLGLGRATIISKPFDMRGRSASDTANVTFWHINTSALTLGQQPINVYVNDTNDISSAVLIGSASPVLTYNSSTFTIPASFNGPRNYIFFEITAPLISLIPSLHIDNVSWRTFPIVTADVKMFMEGPFKTGNMSADLNSRHLIPGTQPYTTAPYNYNGSENVDTSFFTSHPDIVDWVLLELRATDTSTSFISRRSAFIKTDGKIVDLDGTSPVTFDDVVENTYYVVVYHRNHIISMSSTGINFGTSTASYDFTTGANKFHGGDAKDLGGGVFGMYGGDPENDGKINNEDRNKESTQQSFIQYDNADTNMDGEVDGEDYGETDSNIGKVATVPFIE